METKGDEQLAQEVEALADQFEDRRFGLMAIRRVAGRLLANAIQQPTAKPIPADETQDQRGCWTGTYPF